MMESDAPRTPTRAATLDATLAAVLDAAPVAQALLDRELCVTRTNGALERSGLLVAGATGRPLREALPGPVGAQAERLARAALGGREVCTGALVELDVHWEIRCFAVRLPDGELLGAGVMLEDVSGRDRTVDALRLSRERLRAMFDASPIGITVRDADARLLECNRAYARLLGHTPAELVGTDLSAVTAPEHLAATLADYQALWHSDGPMDTEYTLRSSDGRPVQIRAAGSTVRDAGGSPIYRVSLVEDVTERNRLQAELAQVQRAEAVGRLAAGVAHDFNNMLAAILGFTEVVSQQLAPADVLQEDLGEIRRAAEHSRELTRELLAFGRQQVLERSLVAVAGVVDGLGRMLRRTLPASIELIIEDRSNGAHVLVDRAQLEQVIVNLALNARDAMPRGGRLSLRTGAGSGAVTISVTDTGEGMTDEVREHIFEPFFTTKQFGKGTGLGLATVFGIVEQSGGTISIDSVPGAGSTFVVTLPRAAPEPEGEAGEAPPAPVACGPGRVVLVVEDEDQVRRLMRRVLERDGHTVLAAATGAEALGLLDTHPGQIDLLLSDMILPDLHGAELAARAHELRPSLVVLYSSGYPGDEIARDGLPSGAGFLPKPFTADGLRGAVVAAFRGSSA